MALSGPRSQQMSRAEEGEPWTVSARGWCAEEYRAPWAAHPRLAEKIDRCGRGGFKIANG